MPTRNDKKIWYHSNNYNNMWHVTKQLCVLMAVIVDREKQPHHIYHNLMNVEKQFILVNGLSRGNRPCFFGLPTFNEKWFILNGFVSGVSTFLLHKAKNIFFFEHFNAIVWLCCWHLILLTKWKYHQVVFIKRTHLSRMCANALLAVDMYNEVHCCLHYWS